MTTNDNIPGIPTIAEVLEAAANLLESEGRWIPGREATDANGEGVHFRSRHAVAWSVLGAIYKCGKGQGHRAVQFFNVHIGGSHLNWKLPTWEERNTQAAIVEDLRNASAAARGQRL